MTVEEMVKEFHAKLNVLEGRKATARSRLLATMYGMLLVELSQQLEKELDGEDVTMLRMHLMMEELGELLKGMGNIHLHEETPKHVWENILDACCDLVYVTAGTAASYGFKFDEALERVHASNMTKQSRGHRFRDKGPDWQPAELGDLV